MSTIKLTRQCPMCNEVFNLEVDGDAYYKWRTGALIQDAFPTASPEFREKIKTGYCDKCQAILFRNPFEDCDEEEPEDKEEQ